MKSHGNRQGQARGSKQTIPRVIGRTRVGCPWERVARACRSSRPYVPPNRASLRWQRMLEGNTPHASAVGRGKFASWSVSRHARSRATSTTDPQPASRRSRSAGVASRATVNHMRRHNMFGPTRARIRMTLQVLSLPREYCTRAATRDEYDSVTLLAV